MLTRYSELVKLVINELKDQLKKHKKLGKSGFTLTQSNRPAYILHAQTLMLEADAEANDLPDGESGIEGRGVRCKSKSAGGGAKKKRKKGMIYWMDYEWTEEEQDCF